jgi:hypothetical protein
VLGGVPDPTMSAAAPPPPEPPASPSEQSPLERVLDVAVYGPVGLALAAREHLPRWVEVGRRQVESRLAMARAVGRLAVDQGSRQTGEVLRRLAQQAEGALAAAGLVPRGDDDLDIDEPDEVRTPMADPSRSTAVALEEPEAPVTGPGPVRTRLDPAELAIPGYDTLSASQIVQRLPGLSVDELEAVRTYELAGRARKTVLLRVAQLKAAS